MSDLHTLPNHGLGWLDASGEHAGVVLSTRIRLARNLQGHAFGPRARVNDREAVLDQTASGWRQQIELRRQTNSISIAGALPSQNRPQVDHFAERGILLAGDWLESEHWLADAAVDTGLRAGAMIQERSS